MVRTAFIFRPHRILGFKTIATSPCMKKPSPASLFAGLLMALALPSERADGAITLVNATATIEQADVGDPFLVSRAIDGDTTSSTQGWAVFPGRTSNQTSVFQTSSTVVGSDWTFELFFSHFATGHKIQQFRISVTEDLNPTVSSGATWTTLDPISVATDWGGGVTSYLINGDDSIRVSGIVESGGAFPADYTVQASSVSSMNVTGFRLEVFPFDDNGAGGSTLGFQSGGNNGNFVLTEFTATPEPSRALLLVTGLGALIVRRRRSM